MRYQGRIVRWNEARGSGFIVPEQGEGEPKGDELFAHISALQCDGLPPMAGERVSYLIGTGQDGKPRAEQVYFPDRPLSLVPGASLARGRSSPARNESISTPSRSAQTTRPRPHPSYRRKSDWRGKLIPLLALAGLFSIYSRFSDESVLPLPASYFSQGEVSSSHSAPQSSTFLRQCDGRQHCSQMRSCEEATWFLQNCPNTKMDGEGDGIPCEDQWCGH